MNDLLPKFNVYEQLVYLMVGAITLLLIGLNLSLFGYKLSLSDFSTLGNSIVLALGAYFLGHFIQSLSNSISKIKWVGNIIPSGSRQQKEARQKTFYKEIKEKFHLKKDMDEEAWQVTYMFALSNDKTGQLTQLNSQYGLYRGWTIVFSFNALFYLIYMVSVGVFTPLLIGLAIVSVVVSLVFWARANRYWNYIGNKVFAMYQLYSKQK